MSKGNKKASISLRLGIVFAFTLLLASGVVARMATLQTVQRPHWENLAKEQRVRTKVIPARRGNILAADGSLLATSVPEYEARMDLKAQGLTDELFRAHIDSLAWALSRFFKTKTAAQYKAELVRERQKGTRSYLLARKLNHIELQELKKMPLLRMGRYKSGLVVESRSRRIMPFMPLAQRTIGYKIADVLPVGIEGAFNNYLEGTNGECECQKVSNELCIPLADELMREPRDGYDVITTLDVNFQDYTQAALHKALKTHDAHHGCAVVMEVATGHIKAIANMVKGPNGDYAEEYNYAVGEAIEPGSTFKLASVIALLESGLYRPETQIDIGNGETMYFDRVMRDTRNEKSVLTLEEAFAVSSNVGMSKAVYAAFAKKPQHFIEYLDKLRLADPLGISITGEGEPLVKRPTDRSWSGTTLPWMSIGYEVKLTPLQILTLYNAVANNGAMVKPQFVTAVQATGSAIKEYRPEMRQPAICSERTLRQVQHMLELVVEQGTAKNIKTPQYGIAGKTGTALVAHLQSGYTAQRIYQASFVGYFPAHKPKYSMIVVVTAPSQGVYYGNSVAAPVFREVADKIYARTATVNEYLATLRRAEQQVPLATTLAVSDAIRLMPAHIRAENAPKEEFARVVQGKNTARLEPVPNKKGTVPDVTGMALADALYLLENHGLQVKATGKGKVAWQSLAPGSTCETGNQITINLR